MRIYPVSRFRLVDLFECLHRAVTHAFTAVYAGRLVHGRQVVAFLTDGTDGTGAHRRTTMVLGASIRVDSNPIHINYLICTF